MILFINTFITNKRFSNSEKPISRDHRYSPSRTDVFMYMLSSLSVIKWEKIIIYYELDEDFIIYYNLIDNFINEIFNCEIEIYHYRNKNQTMWKSSIKKLETYQDDKLIWFCCEDDHVFIDLI